MEKVARGYITINDSEWIAADAITSVSRKGGAFTGEELSVTIGGRRLRFVAPRNDDGAVAQRIDDAYDALTAYLANPDSSFDLDTTEGGRLNGAIQQ